MHRDDGSKRSIDVKCDKRDESLLGGDGKPCGSVPLHEGDDSLVTDESSSLNLQMPGCKSAVPGCKVAPGSRATSSRSLSSSRGVVYHGVEVSIDSDLDGDEGPCSWGPFVPGFCQVFLSPKVFLVCICWAGAIQGMVVNGFISVVLSTIERRFDLRSAESGFISSSYDMASVLCLIPVSYLGGSRGGCKPRWIGVGVVLLGLGSLMFALPHFTTPLYDYQHVDNDRLCYGQNEMHHPPPDRPTNMSTLHDVTMRDERLMYCDSFVPKNETNLWKYKYMFIFAQLFHGVGATPLYTLGVTYLDENLKTKVTPVYVGVFYGMAIVGPALGYLFGGELLKYYTDLDRISGDEVRISPDNPKWVGMWWLGFLLAGLTAFLVAIPIFGFPKALPGSTALKRDRISETYHSSISKPSESPHARHRSASASSNVASSILGIAEALKVLLTNPTYMFLNLAGACEGMLVSGFTAFTPKFIESQFSIPAGWSAQLVGLATIPAGGGGTFLGGYIVKRFDLKCASIIRLCLCSCFVSLLLLMVFLVQCDAQPVAGVNVEYTHSNITMPTVNLTSQCNHDCDCDMSLYDPVCGIDKVTYYSACHAGCHQVKGHKGTKVYSDCTCIVEANIPPTPQSYFSWTSLKTGTANEGILQVFEPIALPGKCESSCQLLVLFLPTFFLTILCTFTTSMPALSATLRCVPETERSFSLGIQWIMIRCLGTIPAPILFGTLIDVTCRLWQHKCASSANTDTTSTIAGGGACLFYDNSTMGQYLMGVAIVMKAIAFCFFSMALWLYRPPPEYSTPRSGSVLSRSAAACVGLRVGGGNQDEQLSTSSTIQMLERDPTKPSAPGTMHYTNPGSTATTAIGTRGVAGSSAREPSSYGGTQQCQSNL